MQLGKIEIGFAKSFYLQASVDVTFEGQQRLAGVGGREVRLPLMKTGGIQVGEFIADAHQRSDLRSRKLTRLVDQLLRVVQQFRLGITLSGERALVVERFGR